jgi:pilus assembly protein CpaF
LAWIENMILMANTNLPVPAIRAQVASAIDLIIQVERMRDGVRRVVEVVEVCGMEGEVISTSPLFRFQYQGETLDGHVKGSFEASRTRPHCYPRLDYYGFAKAFVATLERGASA